jgi:hypothetical protein
MVEVIDAPVEKTENDFQRILATLTSSSTDANKAYEESEEPQKKEIFEGWCSTAIATILKQVD